MSPVLIANTVAAGIALYVVIAVVVAAAARDTGDYDNHGWAGLLGGSWPLLLACGLFILPFVAIGWLGARLRNWTERHK